MALSRRQSYTYEIFDDQSPEVMKTYQGNWTHYIIPGQDWVNDTITLTTTPGATFSLTFGGSKAYLYGGVVNVSTPGDWPSADYTTDGVPGGSQKPHFDTDNSSIIYFETPPLNNGTHTINVTVTVTNDTNPYAIDCFLVVPTPGGDSGGIETIRAAPSSTSSVATATQSTPIGAIVGGVVGGIAVIVVLAIAAFYFLNRRSRGGQAYYFEKPGAADMLEGEDRVEPFNAAPTTPATPGSPPLSSAGFSGRGPQSAYSDSSSNQPLSPSFGQTALRSQPSQYSQSGPSEAGVTYVSSTSAQPRTGKAALVAQQYENVPEEPVQYQDSGIRFNETGGQEPGSSQLPRDVPPTYSPN